MYILGQNKILSSFLCRFVCLYLLKSRFLWNVSRMTPRLVIAPKRTAYAVLKRKFDLQNQFSYWHKYHRHLLIDLKLFKGPSHILIRSGSNWIIWHEMPQLFVYWRFQSHLSSNFRDFEVNPVRVIIENQYFF